MVTIFCFLRNLHTVLHSGCASLHSHQRCRRLLFSPHPFQYLLFCKFLLMAILTSMRYYLTVVLIYIFLITLDIEHLFMCPLANHKSTLKKYLFRSSAYFFDFFYIELPELFIYFGDEYLVSCIICRCLLPFCSFSFHCDYGFLYYAKALNFNKVLFYFCFYFHYSRRWTKKNIATIYVKECSGSLIVSSRIFRFSIHFECIFVYGVRECSNFNLICVAVWFSLPYLLEEIAFSPWYSHVSFVID